MYPPVYATLSADAGVLAEFGASPRVYPAGDVPVPVTKPYAVHQTIGGSPENYLGQVPDADSYLVQMDVYGDTVASVTDGAEAIRDALEAVAYVISWRGITREVDTRLYRMSFDVEFQTPR
jgi:hypothetical protein